MSFLTDSAIIEQQIRELQFYVSPTTGRCFAEEFLLQLANKNPSGYAAVRARLARAQAGSFGQYRTLGEKIFELKIHYGPGYRIYCTMTATTLVALCGNTKGTKKRQSEDIKTAKSLAAEFWNELRNKSS